MTYSVPAFDPLSQGPLLDLFRKIPLLLTLFLATGLGTREGDWTSFFDINPNTGVVTQKRGLNRQTTREVILTIKVGIPDTRVINIFMMYNYFKVCNILYLSCLCYKEK